MKFLAVLSIGIIINLFLTRYFKDLCEKSSTSLGHKTTGWKLGLKWWGKNNFKYTYTKNLRILKLKTDF